MASKVTLKDVKDAVEGLVVKEGASLTNLINRAVERLYADSATPDASVLVKFTDTVDPYVEPTAFLVTDPNLQNLAACYTDPDYNPTQTSTLDGTFVGLNVDKYDAAQRFKYGSSIREIIPLEATFNPNGYDFHAFIDYGTTDVAEMIGDPSLVGATAYRLYRVPQTLESSFDITRLVAIARVAFVPAINPDDKFPIRSVEACKLAVLASNYEDLNDLERASVYWNSALNAMASTSARYRGGQKHRMSFDPYPTGGIDNMM